MTVQIVEMLIEPDELGTGPDAAKEIKPHLTTVYRSIKKGGVFLCPIHDFGYPRINEAQALK